MIHSLSLHAGYFVGGNGAESFSVALLALCMLPGESKGCYPGSTSCSPLIVPWPPACTRFSALPFLSQKRTFAEAFLAFVPASIISVTHEDVKLSCKRRQTCFVLLRVDDSYQNGFF